MFVERLDFEEYPGGLDPVDSILLHVMAKASERQEDLSGDALFMGNREAAEHLYAAVSCVLEDDTDTAKDYFIDTGLVSEMRLADAIGVSVDELRLRLLKTN